MYVVNTIEDVMTCHRLPEDHVSHLDIMEVCYVVNIDCTNVDIEVQVGPHGQPILCDTIDMVTFENMKKSLEEDGITITQLPQW